MQKLFGGERVREEVPLAIKSRNMMEKVSAVMGNQQCAVNSLGALDVFGQVNSGIAAGFHYDRANDEIENGLCVGQCFGLFRASSPWF